MCNFACFVKMWDLASHSKRKMVFENNTDQNIWTKVEELVEGWRKLHSEEWNKHGM
jgi:hypothetical protein